MAFKNLILFAGAPPFRDLTTYLNTEIHYLAPHFEKIYVLVNSEKLPEVSLPENVKLQGLTVALSRLEKWSGLNAIMQPEVLRELKTFHTNVNAYKSIFYHFNAAKKYASQLEGFLKDNSLDTSNTLFYSYWTDHRTIALSLLKKKNSQLKFITRMHGWDIYWERHSEGYLPFRRLLLNNVDSIFFISEHGKEYFKQKLSLKEDSKLKLRHLGVKDHGLNPSGKINSNTLYLVSCSFSIKLKRIDLIAEALSEINDIDIEWTHIGGGSNQSNFEQSTHILLKDKHNIKYQFLDEIPQESVMEHYHQNHYDLFINVSTFEGIPIGMMEALSFGIPLMGTKTGGVAEIIEQGKNGFLLPNHPSPKEVAEQIKTFYQLLEDERSGYRSNARSVWEEKFNADKNYGAFIKDIFALQEN